MNIHVPAGPAPRSSIEVAVTALRADGTAARIPAGLTVRGEAHYPCDLAVDGTIEGSLVLAQGRTLLVTEHARAEGKVLAEDLCIEGIINGEIDCSQGAVEFAPSARCKAKVCYRELSVARGADVEADLQQVGARRG